MQVLQQLHMTQNVNIELQSALQHKDAEIATLQYNQQILVNQLAVLTASLSDSYKLRLTGQPSMSAMTSATNMYCGPTSATTAHPVHPQRRRSSLSSSLSSATAVPYMSRTTSATSTDHFMQDGLLGKMQDQYSDHDKHVEDLDLNDSMDASELDTSFVM